MFSISFRSCLPQHSPQANKMPIKVLSQPCKGLAAPSFTGNHDTIDISKQKNGKTHFSGVFGPISLLPTQDEFDNWEQNLPAAQGQVTVFVQSNGQAPPNHANYYIATANDAGIADQANMKIMNNQNVNQTLVDDGHATLEHLAERAQDKHPASRSARH